MLAETPAEFESVRQALADSLTGNGRVMIISGPVGSGKTTLLRAAAREAAAAGARYESVTAFRLEREAPLGAPVLGAGHVEELLTLAAHGPLVVGIDDAHLLDELAMTGLLYLVRQIRTEPVLLLLTESSSFPRSHAPAWADLLSQPHCEFLRLDLLSADEVRVIVDRAPGLPAWCRPAMCHDLTGGNPRLLDALIEDYRLDAPDINGTSFQQGVLTCLLRGDPNLLPAAQALAVFGTPATAAQLGEMAGLDVASVAWALDAATAAGLLEDGDFRHEQARRAVLQLTGPRERTELHERAARLLYREGAPAVTVARHKIAGSHAETPWSAAVLQEAADEALDSDNVEFALDCLRLAEQHADEDTRLAIRHTMVRAKWRINPAAVERDVDELLAAHRAGRLNSHQRIELAKRLAWYGRPDEAAALLDTVDEDGRPDREQSVELRSTRSLLSWGYPGHLSTGPASSGRAATPLVTSTRSRMMMRAAEICDSLRGDGFSDAVVDGAQAVLRQTRLDDYSYGAVVIALLVLVQSELLDRARLWCDALLTEADYRQSATWFALLSGVRSMISFRQDDMAAAERHGRASLSRISPRALGVFVGLPLSVLLQVASRSGRFDLAEEHLSVRVPDGMFAGPIGLPYLEARARYYLARQDHRSAIEDFEACGELMVRWGLDLPGIVPWRTGLAETYLSAGRPEPRLAAEQLGRIGPCNRRTRGITLRVLAASVEPPQRPGILREAAETLRDSGGQLEPALADEPPAIEAGRPEKLDAAVADIGKLSDAERRVASLAAQGQTNRQIAGRLFITVSTVEQHLTRTYRKLKVKSRSDLPCGLLSATA